MEILRLIVNNSLIHSRSRKMLPLREYKGQYQPRRNMTRRESPSAFHSSVVTWAEDTSLCRVQLDVEKTEAKFTSL